MALDLALGMDPLDAVRRAYDGFMKLSTTRSVDRSHALQTIAQFLQTHQDAILEANTLDLEASREMAVPDLVLDWLKLTPGRLQAAIQSLKRIAELPDPIRRVLYTPHQISQSQAYSQLMPLGVIALVYEGFPELGIVATGLCVKTGNTLILRGGSESSYSNRAIVETIQTALQRAGFPEGTLEFVSADQGASIRELVTQDQYINLVIPYGRPSLVQEVVRQATVPVLKAALGNCYLYWSPSGDLDTARWMITDSHQSEPDPVNAVEKVLVQQDHSRSALTRLWNSLREKGFSIRADAQLVGEFPDLALVADDEWSQPYLTRTVAFKTVENIDAAINWINHHSSGHADCLVTESYRESHLFSLGVTSASVFVNASPRFWRNPKQADAVFLGMSNQKGYRRGLISMEALTTIKQIVQGNGLE
ncbi:MAG: glutamate-5-semialdehyde dehydrogenase [Cyanobacteria bacterium]|nr:glutamate-5-semialdehyde dehydrogenase [Cyanobacteriota bacterium]MDW8199772.1 glutamate-5-semialdehyde dehydrogenase [Cyanobacteriota bacterium SKYGB_h_bin112]